MVGQHSSDKKTQTLKDPLLFGSEMHKAIVG